MEGTTSVDTASVASGMNMTIMAQSFRAVGSESIDRNCSLKSL